MFVTFISMCRLILRNYFSRFFLLLKNSYIASYKEKVMAGNYIPISSWAEDDKPREKMLLKGVAALSTNELLAILIRSGSGGESALDLSRRILTDASNDLNALALSLIHILHLPGGKKSLPVRYNRNSGLL